jgi:tRNA (guanine37-N1)-methyltransferase
MAKEAFCLKIPKSYGERAIVLANKLKISSGELEVQRNSANVYIPLLHQPSKIDLETLKGQLPELEVLTRVFPERKKRITAFVELLEEKLPPHLLASLPRAMDFVGDIAIVEVPSELSAYKNVIGEAILQAYKKVETVLAKAGAVSGTYRLRGFEVIAGKPKTETVYREYGCQYHVDLAKAYLSPRLSYEHKRVASLVEEGETVIDMFAGVGPFAILIAKTHENVKVYAIDINPNAVEFLKKNIRVNRVEDRVYPILGDARQVVKQRLTSVADRVIMNLPEKAMEFVDAACEALKPTGGIVHFYAFVDASKPLENVKTCFIQAVAECGRGVEKILFSRLVRATAPFEWQVVLDVNIH